jgi:hypothetical protein
MLRCMNFFVAGREDPGKGLEHLFALPRPELYKSSNKMITGAKLA